ncbi:hypothetical protein LXL04_001943 [Taraxacum kok-saghyz]
MIKFAKTASFYASLILIILLTSDVTCRVIHDTTSNLISDGTNTDPTRDNLKTSSFLHLKGIDDINEEQQHCEQMYGFLPCSENLMGHLFLIVVYEYLLFHGESYVASGGKRIFQILGPGIFGASAFQVLGFLPESLILLVSGLSDTKDGAQEYVLTGVGLLAGSGILILTLLWGTCVMIGSRKFPSESGSIPSAIPNQNRLQKLLSLCTGSGVITDEETNHAAKIMVLSVIPFAFLLIPELFGAKITRGYVLTIALPISVLFLIVYFVYQVFEPSIQKRRLAYVRHEHLVVDILKHLQEHTAEKILTEDGSPNLPAIKSLFTKIDQDGDSYISFPELKAILQDIKFRKLTWSKDRTLEEIMKEFDVDGDSKVNIDEFVQGFVNWLDETKNAVNKRSYRSVNSWKDLIQIIQPWVQTKKKEEEMMKILVSEIIKHVQRLPLGNFYNNDGTPNISAIKGLFERIDVDNDNFISQSELKKLIMEVDSRRIPEDVDEATAKLMHDLDESGDQQIDLPEFINGFKNWLNSSNYEIIPPSPGPNTDASEMPWERWIDDDGVDRSNWAWTKAIMSLVLGIAMLALLAEPLIHSVHDVSTAANIPSFFISFILVPLATNARAAISAIQTASQGNERTTSLTFSELYDGVFMNNVLGFSVLLAVIYFRGLTSKEKDVQEAITRDYMWTLWNYRNETIFKGAAYHHGQDKTNDPSTQQKRTTSFLQLKGVDIPEKHCEQMYGFLPCSETLLGHIFLIVVYEYLLYHGESYVASGGKRIFKILGPGIFGASAFHVLGFLPESLILLVSGLWNNKGEAQKRKFSSESGSSSSMTPKPNPYRKLLSILNDSGVTTDQETSSAARIMVLSVFPFTFLLIPELFGLHISQGYILIALPVSIMFLLVYFIYQVLEPSIQKRRLSYLKHENLVVDILKHLQEHTAEKLLTVDGSVNVAAIKGFFTKIDRDGDSYISFSELKELLQDIKFRQLTWNNETRIEEIMKEFDKDCDSKVSMEEFVDRFTNWLDEAKGAVDHRPYRSISSWKDLYQIVQPWVQTKKQEQEMMTILVSEIIRHVKSFPLGQLYKEDGTPNIYAIKGLFERIDLDKDNCVSHSELMRLIMEVDREKISWNVDEATDQIMQDFHKSRDQVIDEQEFIDRFKEWLLTSNDQTIPMSPESQSDPSLKPWERWMDDGVDRSTWAWTKAITLLVIGIAILALLAEPLIHSVQNVSSTANIPSFFVSFIFVPLATNARAAISAIKTASQKKDRTTSLTFSELYHGVFMNNVLGFSVLLTVIYFRGLTWDFSREMSAVLIVCIIVGMTTSFMSKFAIWTSFIAYLLYPLSLIFVSVFNKVL